MILSPPLLTSGLALSALTQLAFGYMGIPDTSVATCERGQGPRSPPKVCGKKGTLRKPAISEIIKIRPANSQIPDVFCRNYCFDVGPSCVSYSFQDGVCRIHRDTLVNQGFQAKPNSSPGFWFYDKSCWQQVCDQVDTWRMTDPSASYDDQSFLIEPPFPVNFYGQTYNSVWMSSNGFLSFGQQPGLSFTNSDLPTTNMPPESLAVFWDDLLIPAYDASSLIRDMGMTFQYKYPYENSIEFHWKTGINPSNGLFVEVVVSYDPVLSGDWVVRYYAVDSSAGNTATVGAQSARNGGKTTLWSYNSPLVTPGLELTFVTLENRISDGTFDVFS